MFFLWENASGKQTSLYSLHYRPVVSFSGFSSEYLMDFRWNLWDSTFVSFSPCFYWARHFFSSLDLLLRGYFIAITLNFAPTRFNLTINLVFFIQTLLVLRLSSKEMIYPDLLGSGLFSGFWKIILFESSSIEILLRQFNWKSW